MSKWKAWEEETWTLHHQIANGNLYCFTMLFSLLYVLRWPSLATPVNVIVIVTFAPTVVPMQCKS